MKQFRLELILKKNLKNGNLLKVHAHNDLCRQCTAQLDQDFDVASDVEQEPEIAIDLFVGTQEGKAQEASHYSPCYEDLECL